MTPTDARSLTDAVRSNSSPAASARWCCSRTAAPPNDAPQAGRASLVYSEKISVVPILTNGLIDREMSVKSARRLWAEAVAARGGRGPFGASEIILAGLRTGGAERNDSERAASL
jgi:hypothetical protein